MSGAYLPIRTCLYASTQVNPLNFPNVFFFMLRTVLRLDFINIKYESTQNKAGYAPVMYAIVDL